MLPRRRFVLPSLLRLCLCLTLLMQTSAAHAASAPSASARASTSMSTPDRPAPALPAAPTSAAAAPDCPLYPIALSTQSLAGVTVGATISDIANGSQPGTFGWLSWGGSPSEPTLVASLTPPGDGPTYINPDDPTDHVIRWGIGSAANQAYRIAVPCARRWIT